MSVGTTIFTRVYNTKPYLVQCVESILNQSYGDFEYIIVDNGCTDGSSEILRYYAERDKRIHLIRFEENQRGFWRKITRQFASGEYLTVIDSDDWWEPDYLQRMIDFMETNQLDLAVTGTINYFDKDGSSRIMRKLDKQAFLTRREFAQRYPVYWTFPSTIWGNIMKASLFRSTIFPEENISYGGDTINMLRYLEQCDRIGIDNSALYHYRIREKSVSSEYDEYRFPGNVYFYNCVVDFLNKHDALDKDKQEWLKRVHANSIRMTAETLANSKLSAEEKLGELCKITEHPLTKAVLSLEHSEIDQTRSILLSIALKNADASREDFDAALQGIIPRCASAVTPECAPLFGIKQEFAEALVKDNPDALLTELLYMLRVNEQTKKFDITTMLRALSVDKPLLRNIDDKPFLRRYGNIYLTVWREKYDEALDTMTGMLLDGEKASETFLQLYLSLAALLNQPEAFVFGKIKLAQTYLRKNKKEDCRRILSELAEMGVEDNVEIIELKNSLK